MSEFVGRKTKCSDEEEWVDCWNCDGEGYSHHDCGEDSCCCLMPENDVKCYRCDGNGGYMVRYESTA